MKSIGVIGSGFVGGSLTTVFAERGATVYVYDKASAYKPGASPSVKDNDGIRFPNSINELVTAVEALPDFSGIYFVCLPTPMNIDDGSCDLSIVEGALTELAGQPGKRIAVVKSTVPPGTVETWNKKFNDGLVVIHSPEFLREASALEDQRNQTHIILGGPRPHINVVRDFLRSVFPDVPILKTSSSNSELTKMFINTFLATKVSFANEFYQVCESLASQLKLDVDYDRIIELATLDERIGKSHLKVPGPMPADDGTGRLLRGFAGSCFIKDINSLISIAKEMNVDPKVLTAAWLKNLEVRPEQDWLNLKGRAVSKKPESA